jgi:DNA polymerase III, gamma/tau subunits
MLKRILQKEKLSFDDYVLKIIADHSESSFRDATKILQEIITQNLKTKEEIEVFLGIKGKENFLAILEKKEPKLVFSFIDQFAKDGGNFKNLIEDLLENLHLCLLQKKGIAVDLDQTTNLSTKEITLLIKLLMEAYQNLKITPIESLPLEIALAEFYERTKDKNS